MGLAVGQPVKEKEIEVRWRAGGPPHPRMDTIPKHVEQPESPRTRFRYKTNTRTTPQSHYHHKESLLRVVVKSFMLRTCLQELEKIQF
jgi:hypothetical protein